MSETAHVDGHRREARWDLGIGVVVAVIVAAAALRPLLQDLLDRPAVAHWATIFVAITVQAMPFLVLGITVSAAIAAFVPDNFLPRVLPDRPALAVPVAAVAGAALPGCECGSVPIAGRLVQRGALPAAALTFLLSAPAINPVVLVSTAVAFPGNPEVVAARALASLLAATVVGLIWARFGNDKFLERARRRHTHDGPPLSVLVETAQHDLLQAGGFLIIGAATAATLQTVVPRSILDGVASSGLASVLALAGLAVVMAICSEADAFVAASLTQFSLTARLAFMVVGPMVDVKLIALQTGTFGGRFAVRFAPLTFVVAVSSAIVVGWWLL
ncbi:MAG TPA: permease [Gaiellaceae bacterium]|nr:permease [Gaiellaceae bacterium]HVD43234.1 permease [Gaiellaceae bacterium]